jgi:hypothetical protein
MAWAFDSMLLFRQQERPFMNEEYSAALKLLDHLTGSLGRLHDHVYALMQVASPAEGQRRAASDEKGPHPVCTPDEAYPNILQMPRHPADL